MRRHRGHTLVELLVVLAIMMVLAAIALPSISPGFDRKLDTVQLAMQDALDHASSLATTQAAIYGVRFHPGEEWFAVVDAEGKAVSDPLSHHDYLIRLEMPETPADVTIEAVDFGGYEVAVFNEKGVLYEGGELMLRAGPEQRRLVIDTATAAFTEIPLDG
jgi:prepilin-type N-terminal cleavage/methylation domain-containing protein